MERKATIMKTPSRVAEALPRSGIREIMDAADRLDGVIHLEVGEPSFTTPSHIVDAALDAAREGATKYTPNAGLPSVRQAIADHHAAAWRRPVAAEQVLVTAGAVNAIAAMVIATCEEGDEVLVPDPGWPNYASIVALSRARAVRYPLRPDHGYLPNPSEVAARITPRTKALILNSPGNPTGAVFPAATVEALVRLAAEHDLFVISDEVYEKLVFDGTHVPAARFDDGQVITISGCSKTYAMTGWRLGWAIADPSLVRVCGKVQEALVSCASAVSQRACEAALHGPQACVTEMREAYRRRRDLVRQELEPIGLLPTVPQGAFYALVDLCRAGRPSRDVSRALLVEERVATAPGSTFGDVAEGMVRISLAAAEPDLVEGCHRIRRFAERSVAAASSPPTLAAMEARRVSVKVVGG